MYKSKLDFFETEKAIKFVKDVFQKKLSEKLSLSRVSAPRFVDPETGLQDDLAGTQEPVSFSPKGFKKRFEVVHSLAKWKRFALGKYGFKVHTGLYTDMEAIRKDEVPDDIHSVYVDQWDWEKIIISENRNLNYLKETVKLIYSAIKETKKEVSDKFLILNSKISENIIFIHAEELEDMYPNLSPKEREVEITKKYGAVFLIGIGHILKSGIAHDVRAADYDDWSTETSPGKYGLNGDILVWDSVRQDVLELSSMGIRVDVGSLKKQLALLNLKDYAERDFHKKILSDKLPLSIGGGIGQSRICMFLLEKIHIGEVQSSIWPEDIIEFCKSREIFLL